MTFRSALLRTVAAASLLALAACSHPKAAPTPPPTQTPTRVANTPAVGGGKSSTPTPTNYNGDISDCSWGSIDVPETFAVPARNLSDPMLAVGLDAEGNVGSPPKDQMMTMAWWSGGPKVGSDQGHVILTAHMGYGLVGLGNILADPASGLQKNDVIKVTGSGKTVCYAYSELVSIDVATYDPQSTIWINPNGAPRLSIMICWNYQPSTGEWAQRHLFFAEPIKK